MSTRTSHPSRRVRTTSRRAVDDDVLDVLIIGAGQAGVPLARELATRGKRVGLAERKHLGGSCVNFGCTPTKAVIASARVAQLARRGVEFGLDIPRVAVDFKAVLERAKMLVTQSQLSIRDGLTDRENLRLYPGHARFTGRLKNLFQVQIGDQSISTREVILDTGTRSAIPPIAGLDDIPFLEAGNWLDHSTPPRHLAVIGGSYTGLEMAQFYRRMGSQVTVIDESAQITKNEDEDVATAIQHYLESEGVAFRLGAQVTKARAQTRTRIELVMQQGRHSSRLTFSHLFVATGRQPNTDDLGLEKVGVKLAKDGTVPTDKRLATRVRGIWAAGDIRGGAMFTHTAWDDHRVLLSQIAGDGSRTTERLIPYAIYTDPQLGRVGLTEREAKKSRRPLHIGRYDMKKNGKAKEIGETGGFIKVIADARSRRILGASVLAADGAELVHLFVDVMNARSPYSTIGDAIYVHPTLAEAVQSTVTAIA